MTEFHDDLETREPAAREAALFESLRDQIVRAQAEAPGMAGHLEGIAAGAVTGRAELAGLPVLRKLALIEMQRADPPFGGLTTRPAG